MGVKACVLFGFVPSGYAPTVILPVQQAAYLVGKHLIEKGHTHIGLLVPNDPWQVPAVQSRIRGLNQAAEEARLGNQFQLQQIETSGELLDTRAKIKDMLTSGNPPSAIYGHNDEYSFQVMKTLLEMGIRIPEDMAVVGTDNTTLCEVFHPALTSVAFDMMGLAHRCVKALQYQIEEQPIAAGLLDGLQPVLIPRQSS
jgi:LacI family transcriptional regulator